MKIEQVEVLVLAAQEGKRDALELLYRHFFTPMKRYALIRVHQTTTAEYLVQNVWLKVGRRLQFMQDVRVFRSWLLKRCGGKLSTGLVSSVMRTSKSLMNRVYS
jgi:RNA polymerase sigma-70 factor (ECF subfamily)